MAFNRKILLKTKLNFSRYLQGFSGRYFTGMMLSGNVCMESLQMLFKGMSTDCFRRKILVSGGHCWSYANVFRGERKKWDYCWSPNQQTDTRGICGSYLKQERHCCCGPEGWTLCESVTMLPCTLPR